MTLSTRIQIVHRDIDQYFFSNDTATTEIYTLSLHDALPICPRLDGGRRRRVPGAGGRIHHQRRPRSPCPRLEQPELQRIPRDRKSTRLNSSHQIISYAVFFLKKKKENAYTSRVLSTEQLTLA